MPETPLIKQINEPYVKAEIMVPNDYVGAVMELCQRKRGTFVTMDYLDDYRVNVIYEIPLSEIIFDFFDKLKSSTRGYASLDYELDGTRPSDLVKIDILLNGDKVDALSFISHRQFAQARGRVIVDKLKTIIPRQNFEIPIYFTRTMVYTITVTKFPERKGPKWYGTRSKVSLDHSQMKWLEIMG